MKTAKPIEVRQQYINKISRGLEEYFYQNLFKSLFDVLKNNKVINSKDTLINAVKSGKIYYSGGAFRSPNNRFSNAVASELEKLGAKYKYNAYYIEKSLLPIELTQTIGIMAAQANARLTAIDKILSGYLATAKIPVDTFIKSTVKIAFEKLEEDILQEAINNRVPVIELGLVKPKTEYDKNKAKGIEQYYTIRAKEKAALQSDLNKAYKDLNKAQKDGDLIKVNELSGKIGELNSKIDTFNFETNANAPTLDYKVDDVAIDYKSSKIAEDYTYNMRYWVQKWEVKNIIKMRQDIVNMYQQGARIPQIQEYFQKRWKLATNKARFLAENEIGLVSATVQATTWQETGASKFEWRRSLSKEKRKLHEEYYGKVFEYANPPIIDEKLGIRGLPRCIWNCKCQMAPVIPTINEMIQARKDNKNVIKRITNSLQRNNNPWRYRRFGERQTLQEPIHTAGSCGVS